MQKIISLAITLVFILGLPQVKGTGIEFEQGSWEQILEKAQQEKKFIFVDCMTTWCAPCKWMAKNVMTLPEVASFYNQHFINVKLDMEKGDGKVLAKKFSINAYPTFAFFTGAEELVWRAVGSCKADEFIALGQKVLDGVDPVQEIYDKYASGNYDREFLYQYLLHCDENGIDYEKALDEYMEEMKPADLLNETDYEIFQRFVSDTDSEFFLEFEKDLDAFKEKFGAKKVEQKYYRSWMDALNQAVGKNDQDKVQEAVKKIETIAPDHSMVWVRDFLIANQFLNFSKQEGYALIKEYLDKGEQVSTMTLNNHAWEVFAEVDDPDLVKEAIRWAGLAFEEAKNDDGMSSAILDTWGMLLMKSGDLEGAEEKLEESIMRGKRSNEDVSESEKALEKIKQELGK